MGITASLDNFEAASEFWGGLTVTCGQRAFSTLQHVLNPSIMLDGPEIVGLYQDMRAKGYNVTGGTTMAQLCSYFSRYQGLPIIYSNGYGSSWDAIHRSLLDHAGRDGVVIEVELAYNLTGNEPGVHRHFVSIGAIHPTLGYLVANGDDMLALNAAGGHGKVIPCRWMDRNVIASAVPSACAIVTGLPHSMSLPASMTARPFAKLAYQLSDATEIVPHAVPASVWGPAGNPTVNAPTRGSRDGL